MYEKNCARILMNDGSVKCFPIMPALIAKDGTVLYNSEQVTIASKDELTAMRNYYRAYNAALDAANND